LLVHGPAAAAQVRKTFPTSARKITLIDHGHWVGYYADTVSRAAAREKLGLSEGDYVFLFLGLCKPYKNLEGLIAAFRRMPEGAKLVIAGRFQSRAYQAAIEAALAGLGRRVVFHPRYVADEELQIYLRACDAVVLPYTEILTSGSAMLALSFGKPVVAPAIGFLKDAVAADCGCLYEPSDADGLRQAMESAMARTFDQAAIIAHAKTHDWTKSAQAFLDGLA
jgi:glycosyltransferase involved in cell wall biosynthesis